MSQPNQETSNIQSIAKRQSASAVVRDMLEIRSSRDCRRGLSLMELLAVVMIMGVLAIVVVPRLSSGATNAKTSSCEVNTAIIEVQAVLWRRDYGNWPASDLQTIGADKGFFPEGLPICPHGQAYKIDASTGRVVAHKH